MDEIWEDEISPLIPPCEFQYHIRGHELEVNGGRTWRKREYIIAREEGGREGVWRLNFDKILQQFGSKFTVLRGGYCLHSILVKFVFLAQINGLPEN